MTLMKYGFKKYKKSRRGRPRKKRYGAMSISRKIQAKKRKAYRNRQQKLSVLTVKSICRRMINKNPETNYAEIEEDTISQVGHPSLYNASVSATQPQPRFRLLTDYLTCHQLDKNDAGDMENIVLSQTNGDSIYQEKQDVYIKNIQIKLQVFSPKSQIGTHPCSQWCDLHWCILRTSNAPSVAGITFADKFPDTWYKQISSFRRDNKTTGYSIIKSGVIDASPNKKPVSMINNYSERIFRKTINVPINKILKVMRNKTAGNHAGTDATTAGNLNSYNLWLLFYVHQQYQGIKETTIDGVTTKLYNNSYAGNDTGEETAACKIDYVVTLSGFGKPS